MIVSSYLVSCSQKESQPCDLIRRISCSGHMLISLTASASGASQKPTPSNETVHRRNSTWMRFCWRHFMVQENVWKISVFCQFFKILYSHKCKYLSFWTSVNLFTPGMLKRIILFGPKLFDCMSVDVISSLYKALLSCVVTVPFFLASLFYINSFLVCICGWWNCMGGSSREC